MKETVLREFIQNYEAGKYDNPDRDTMIDAGWYDWHCEDNELKPKLDNLFPKVKQLSASEKIDMDKMYVVLYNNCPNNGSLYDDFRICDMDTGDIVYMVVPATGHTSNKGQAELWGPENDFKGTLAEGEWRDIEAFFGVAAAASGTNGEA